MILKCSNGHVHDTDSLDHHEATRVVGGPCNRRVGDVQCGARLHLVRDDAGVALRFTTGRLVAIYPRLHIAVNAPVASHGQITLCRRSVLLVHGCELDAEQIAALILDRGDMCARCIRVFTAVYGVATP